MTANPEGNRRRRSLSERELELVIHEAARGGSWNAAAWLLERKWPIRWATWSTRKPPADMSAPPEPEPDEDRFGEVVALARRRSRRPS
jgi:hypothetical protein